MQVRAFHVPARRPEGMQGPVRLRPQRMILRALHGAEGRHTQAQRAGVRLAPVEEGVAQPAPRYSGSRTLSPRYSTSRSSNPDPANGADLACFLRQRQGAAGPHHPPAVPREEHHGVRRVQVRAQVGLLVRGATLVQVRELSEYRDPQPRQIGDERRQVRAAHRLDPQGQAPTCRDQSARL